MSMSHVRGISATAENQPNWSVNPKDCPGQIREIGLDSISSSSMALVQKVGMFLAGPCPVPPCSLPLVLAAKKKEKESKSYLLLPHWARSGQVRRRVNRQTPLKKSNPPSHVFLSVDAKNRNKSRASPVVSFLSFHPTSVILNVLLALQLESIDQILIKATKYRETSV